MLSIISIIVATKGVDEGNPLNPTWTAKGCLVEWALSPPLKEFGAEGGKPPCMVSPRGFL